MESTCPPFVTGEVDHDSHVSQGVFQTAYSLRDAGVLEEHERVVFWRKGTVSAHIQERRQVVTLLLHHGIRVQVLRTHRPGRVYEEEFQVGAIPSRHGVKWLAGSTHQPPRRRVVGR